MSDSLMKENKAKGWSKETAQTTPEVMLGIRKMCASNTRQEFEAQDEACDLNLIVGALVEFNLTDESTVFAS